MKDDGWGMGTGFRPGGALGGPGDGVATGPPAAYGFVRNDVSEVIESIGSRSIGCFPARFDEGDRPVLVPASVLRVCPFPSRGESGRGGAPRGSTVGILVAVTGGWLWNRQKM